MARRMVMQGGATSPLKISYGSVDAAGAFHDQLAFDGSQRAMRVFLQNKFTETHSYTATDGVINFGTVNEIGYGKTFSAPPMVLMQMAQDRLQVNGVFYAYYQRTPTDYQAGADGSPVSRFYYGGWSTLTGFYTPRALSYIVLDTPII